MTALIYLLETSRKRSRVDDSTPAKKDMSTHGYRDFTPLLADSMLSDLIKVTYHKSAPNMEKR